MGKYYHLGNAEIKDGRKKVTYGFDVGYWVEQDTLEGSIEDARDAVLRQTLKGFNEDVKYFFEKNPGVEDWSVETYENYGDCGYYETEARLVGWMPLTEGEQAFLDLEEKKVEAAKVLKAATKEVNAMRAAINTIKRNQSETSTGDSEAIRPLLLQLEELLAVQAEAELAEAALLVEK